MKCPSCNYINSDSRTNCKQCNFSFLIENNQKNHTKEDIKTPKYDEIEYKTRDKLNFSESEFNRVKTKLFSLRNIKKAKKPLTNNVNDLEFNQKITLVYKEISDYVTSYKNELSQGKKIEFSSEPSISQMYLSLSNSIPNTEIEYELNLFPKPNEEKKLIEDLYNLQLKELSDVQNNKILKKNIKTSHTRSIDRESLKDTYHNLKADLLSDETEETETKLKDATDLLKPSSSLIFFAFILDLTINILLTISLFLSNKFMESNFNFFKEFITDYLKTDFLYNNSSQIITLFVFCWIIINFFFLTLFKASLGQKILGLKVSTLNGSTANLKLIYFRFSLQIINILSFGIRPLLQIAKDNAFECKASKTKLSFASFVN